MKAFLAIGFMIGALGALAQAQPASDAEASELARLDERMAAGKRECAPIVYTRARRDLIDVIDSASPESRAAGQAILARHPEAQAVNWRRLCPSDNRIQVAINLHEDAITKLRQNAHVSFIEAIRERARGLLAEAQRRYQVMRQAEDDGLAVNADARERTLTEMSFLNLAMTETQDYANEAPPVPPAGDHPEELDLASAGGRRLLSLRGLLDDAERARARGDCHSMGIFLNSARLSVEEAEQARDIPLGYIREARGQYTQAAARRCAGPEAIAQASAACPERFNPGASAPIHCRCPAGPHTQAVYGNHYYSIDSGVCAAAQHAGAIGPQGGSLRAQIIPGRRYYVAKIRNGITSRRTSPTSAAIIFDGTSDPVEERLARYPICQFIYSVYSVAERSVPLTCRCMAGTFSYEGTVYGSGPYAGDSSICWSARHAGVLRSDDDIVTVTGGPGMGFTGSTRNGVTSRSWEHYPISMTLTEGPR